MAWNKYYIFVKSPTTTDLKEVLAKLHLTHYKAAKQVPLHFTNKPETLFAGFYNGNLILVDRELPFHFFNDTPTETERLFTA
jgi:hypothetical protein